MKLRQGCRGWMWILPVLVIDRLCKLWALRIPFHHGWIEIIPGVLTFGYVENRGMAFGMASGMVWLLIALTAVVLAILAFYLIRHPEEPKLLRTGLWFVMGGGLGNLYDRIAYGYVVDFIRTDFIDFPVFNVADIFVCVGAAMVVLAVLMAEKRKQ